MDILDTFEIQSAMRAFERDPKVRSAIDSCPHPERIEFILKNKELGREPYTGKMHSNCHGCALWLAGFYDGTRPLYVHDTTMEKMIASGRFRKEKRIGSIALVRHINGSLDHSGLYIGDPLNCPTAVHQLDTGEEFGLSFLEESDWFFERGFRMPEYYFLERKPKVDISPILYLY